MLPGAVAAVAVAVTDSALLPARASSSTLATPRTAAPRVGATLGRAAGATGRGPIGDRPARPLFDADAGVRDPQVGCLPGSALCALKTSWGGVISCQRVRGTRSVTVAPFCRCSRRTRGSARGSSRPRSRTRTSGCARRTPACLRTRTRSAPRSGCARGPLRGVLCGPLRGVLCGRGAPRVAGHAPRRVRGFNHARAGA